MVVSKARKRILIAEDDVAARVVLARALAHDYDVVVAADGAAGVHLAQKLPPDLILSDVTMPHMSGLEMVEAIRHALKRKVPVIFMTANDRPVDVIAGIQAGARHYLVKPLALDELEAKVRRVLG